MHDFRPWLAFLSSGTPANRSQQVITGLLLAIPFAFYGSVVLRYCVNVPFWDDVGLFIQSTNNFLEAADWRQRMDVLFSSQAGHTLVMTRLTAIAQYYLGGINFRNTLLFANLGWMLTTALIMWHAHRHMKLPLLYLLPIPYLMLTLSHWEGIDFASAAIQMYWGSSLLAVACLLALTANRGILAGVLFTAAVFWSGGGIALYLIALAYCLLLRQWRTAACFLLVASHALLVLASQASPRDSLQASMPALQDLLLSTLAFMGNLWANGDINLKPLAGIHRITGALLLLAAAWLLVRAKGQHLPKLIFMYVLGLALMAAYARGAMYDYIAISRYSQFALLGSACVYLLLIAHLHSNAASYRGLACMLVTVLAATVWANTLLRCQAPLESNYQQRLQLASNYLAYGSTQRMAPNPEVADATMVQAALLGVFNPESMRQHPLPPPDPAMMPGKKQAKQKQGKRRKKKNQ